MNKQLSLHGGEVYSLAKAMHISPEQLLDFSSNANIFAYSLTADLVSKTPYPFLHYPDSSCAELKESIAQHENTPTPQILVGNGAAELIWFFLQQLAPRKILFIGPVFSEYIKACLVLGIHYTIIMPSENEDFGITPHELHMLWENNADLVIICNPNNPATITYPNFHTVLDMLRSPRLLIDTSYREFLYGTPDYELTSRGSFLRSLRPGVSLFTLHSFTKFFCSPGIRLGYLLGDSLPMKNMIANRPSWMVNPFAQTMGVAFLRSIESYRETLPALRDAVEDTGRNIRQSSLFLPDFVFEGPGFLCCKLHQEYSGEKLFQELLAFGILVRCCDTIPDMPLGYIRIQARPETDRRKLFDALATISRKISMM